MEETLLSDISLHNTARNQHTWQFTGVRLKPARDINGARLIFIGEMGVEQVERNDCSCLKEWANVPLKKDGVVAVVARSGLTLL